nr:hypothetical protein [Tanacetum cinerariifolium]
MLLSVPGNKLRQLLSTGDQLPSSHSSSFFSVQSPRYSYDSRKLKDISSYIHLERVVPLLVKKSWSLSFTTFGINGDSSCLLKFSSSAPFGPIQPCRIPYLLGEPTKNDIPSSESQIDSLDIVPVGNGHGGAEEEEEEEKENFKAPVLIENQPREPTPGLIDVTIEANAENGQIICGHLQSVTVGIQDISSSTGRETFPLKGGKGVAAVNGPRSVKFLEVPAASLVQAIEKNLSAFVVNVIGNPLINIVKDGGIISNVIWNHYVVGSGLDIVAMDPNINEGPLYLKYDEEEDERGSSLHLSKRNMGRFYILYSSLQDPIFFFKWKLGGIAVSIKSDRDGRFTSHFLKSLNKALSTRLDMSTAYHPEIDDVRQRGGDKRRQTGNNNGQRKVINMVWQSNNGLKCKSLYKQSKEWMDVPITFPPVSTDDMSNGALIVEVEVEGYWIQRARLAPAQTELVGFSGEQMIPIGRIELKLWAISSTIHGMMNFPTPKGIATIYARAKPIYECRWSERKVMEQEGTVKETEETRNLSMEEEEKVLVNPAFPEQTITIEKSKVVTREVEEWVKARIVRPVKYPTWISNPVLVKKADGTWRVCIDFKNLNSSCPKDYYPLPEIDLKIEAVMGHPFKCFLDAYKLGRNLKAYVDDMVIKSKAERDMIMDIAKTFDNLRKINMKLNPMTCSFGIGEWKFLGYIVTSEGIRANPKKTKAIADMKSPKTLKEMQSLSGKLAASNSFLYRSAKRSFPFFETLQNITKENKEDYRWTEEAEHVFKELKKFILKLPTLTTLELKETMFVYLAISHDAVSGVLVADQKGKQTPIQYAHPIKVIIDQPIKQILNKPKVSRKLAKYAMELGAHNITYIPRTTVKGQILADFINEIPTGTRHVEACNSVGEEDPKGWTLYTDGASSQKEVGASLILIDRFGRFEIGGMPDERRICSKQRRDGKIPGQSKRASGTIQEVSTIMEVEEDNWMTPIIKCLEEGLCLKNENEAKTLLMKIGHYVVEDGV